MPYIELPNKKYFKVPEGLSDDEALSLAKERFPKLYADTSKAKEGFIPSIKSGLEALTSAYGTAAAPIFDASDEAVRKRVEKSQARRSEIAKAPNWEDVTKAYEQYGVLGGEKPEERGALSSLLGMWRGQLGESLPQMGAIAAGARTGAGLGALTPVPGGTLIGGTLGALAASYPAFVGQNIERQVEEQEKAGAKQPLEFGRAAAAAAPQAALDVAETAFVLGRLGVGKLFSKELASLGTKKAEEELVKASQRSLAKTVGRGVVAGETIEIPTELAQQVLERWQAGLPLFDKGARDEYVGTAVGVAGPAGVFGGVGGVSRRSAAREELRGIQQARAEEQAKQQEQQRVAAEQAQQQREQFEALPPQTQTDIFGETAGAYTPLQGTKLPEGLETQQPEAALQEEYRKTRAEADRLSKIVDAATEQKNVPAYNAALQQLKQIDAAQAELIKVAKERGVILDVDAELKKAQASVQRYMNKQAPVPDALAQRLGALQTEQTRQAQQQTGVTPGPQMDLFDVPRMKAEDTARAEQFAQYMEGQPQFQPTQPVQPQLPAILQDMQDIEEQKRQTAATQKAKEREQMEKNLAYFQEKTGPKAEAGIAAERTALYKERLSKQLEDLGLEQGTRQAEQLLDNPLKTVLVGAGKQNIAAARQYAQVDTALNNKQITPEVAKVFGIKSTTGETLDLTKDQDAETARPLLEQRIKELQDFRKRVFPSKNLIQNGHLTPAGNRFVRMEAMLHELNLLRDAADNTLQKTPAEAKLLQIPFGKEVDEEANKRRVIAAQATANKSAAARKDAMFDFGNLIDFLRKGKTTETIQQPKTFEQQGSALINKIVESAKAEISARRQSAGFPANEAAQNAALAKLSKALNNLLVRAKPQADTVLQAAARKRIELLDKKMTEMVAKGATKEDLAPLLAEERRLRGMLTAPIKRGMTKLGGPGELSKQISERNISELAKLQAGIDSLVEKLVGKPTSKAGKKQIGLFGLAQESFAQAQARAERADPRLQAINKIDTALAEPIMSPEVRKILRDAKDFLNTSVYEDTPTVQKVIDEAFTLADRVVMGREANPENLQEALATATQYVGEEAGQKEMFAESRATVRTTPARFERFRKAAAFNYKQEQAVKAQEAREQTKKAKQETQRTAEEKLAEQEEILERVKNDVEALKKDATAMRMKVDAEIDAVRQRGFQLNKLSSLQKQRLTWMQKAGFTVSERIKNILKGYAQEQAVDINFVEAKARNEYKDFLKKHQQKLVAEKRIVSDLEKYIASIKSEIELNKAKERFEKSASNFTKITKKLPVYEKSLAEKVSEALEPYAVGSRTFKSQLVPVKNAPPGTELAKYEARIKDINKRLRVISKALKLNLSNIELADQEVLEAAGIPDKTKRQRELGNLWARLVTERNNLQERMHMPVTQEVKPTKVESESKPDIQELYGRNLPKQYGKAVRDFEAVQTKLTNAKKIKKPGAKAIKAIENLQKQYDQSADEIIRIVDLAEKYGIPLENYSFTEKAQEKIAKTVRLGTTIGAREGKKNIPAMRTGIPEEAKKPGPVKTAFREATNADSGVAAKDAADVAARVAKALPKGVKFVYAPTLDDAPQAMRDAMAEDGVKTAKGAVLPDGTVVVVGEAHKNTTDFEETIAHELIGHYGVDTVLGPERMQALVDRLFKQGEAHVADVATALGVFPDVETALAGLGYTRPQVDLTRRRIVQAAGAALVTPTMPAKVAEVFNVPNDAAAVDAVFNVWNSADKWIGGLVEKLPVPLRKKAEDIVHEKIYKIAGKDFYSAWSNQGEMAYSVGILEDLVAEKGGAALLNKVKKAYDVAALDIVKLLPTETKVATEKESKQTETSHEQIKMSIVREMIAHAAEGRRVAPTFTEKVKTFIRDMVAAVRGWFRSSGLSDMAKRDAKEIQAIIRQASQDLAAGQLGVYTTPSGEVAFRPGEIDYPAGISASSRDLVDSLIYTKKGLLDRIKANVLGLAGVTQFVDRYAPVWAVLEKGVAGKKITDLEATQIRYNLSARDKVMNFVRLIAAQGPVEYKQKQDAKGAKFWMIEAKDANGANLVKMFEALGEANLDATVVGRLFTTWLGAQRVKNEGIGVEKLNFAKDENGNPIVTKQKLDKLEAEIDAMPQVKNAFEKARKIYNEYNKGLVDFAEQAGALSKEVADSLRSKKDFIPFYRPGAKGNIELVIGDEHPFVVGNLTDQPYLHELVGGDTAISDIFTSAVQNTHLMTDLALRNIATGSVADGLRKLGLLDTRKYKDKETGKDKEALRFSSDMKGSDTLRFRKDGEDVAVRVATDGTAFDGIDPALLVKGLEGVKTTMPAALQLFGVPSKVLRNFVVLSPTYPLRQVIKDSFSVLGTSGADFMPVITPFKNIAKAMSGTSREAALLESQGLLGGQVLGSGTSKDALSAVLRGVVSGKQNASSLLAWAEAKSMQADVGVRVASYNSFLKQGLNEIEAWVATNEIVDFNRRGLSPSVQWANTLYPFFSAQIQGLNVFAKALSGKMPYNERLKIRDKFIQRATLMAAMTVAYAMAMEDDEAYTNATPEQKLNNWFVRTPFFDEPVKIPIPFEFGLLAKAIPEAIYTALSGKEDMEPIGKALVGMGVNSIPGMGNKFPQALLPFIEAYTGKDLFTGADVETAAMQRLDPAERYKENTTGLAKMLGSIGIPGVSPVKVDQFIKGIGSQTLLSMVSLTNALFETSTIEKAEAKASQLPFIGTSFQPNDAGGILNRTYELLQDGERAVNTYKKLTDEGRSEEAEDFLNNNLQRYELGKMSSSFKNAIKYIDDEAKNVRQSDSTPAEKRERLDELRKEKIDIAKRYREAIRQAA